MGHVQGFELCVYLRAVAILGGRVMWFCYVGISQVVLGQCSFESEFVWNKGGLEVLIISREPQSTYEHRPDYWCWGQVEWIILFQLANLLKGFVGGDCTLGFPELGELNKTNFVIFLASVGMWEAPSFMFPCELNQGIELSDYSLNPQLKNSFQFS